MVLTLEPALDSIRVIRRTVLASGSPASGGNNFVIKKIFSHSLITNSVPSRSVASAAFIITLAGLASRLLGLLRDRFLASTFGAGSVLDAYYAAFRVPDLIYNLLIMGALSAAFIPVFTALLSQDSEKEAWKLANGIINIALAVIFGLSAILAVFAPWLMKIITPGFDQERMAMVVTFTRIMFLSPLLLGLSGIFGGILTSYKKFIVYSLAPIFYNLGIIFGVLVLCRWFGPVGLAWGVVFGALMHMLVQLPAVYHSGFNFNFNLKAAVKNYHVRKVFGLMFPRMMGIAVSQINLLVITIFASLLAAGSLAIFNFAQNLQSVPLGLFGISFSIAVFPVLSALSAKNERSQFVAVFSETFRQIIFFVIPLSIAFLLLRAQIVRVVLGAGKFDWQDTILTFQCLEIFSFSLFAQSLIPLLARSFYALHDTKTPFYIALSSEAVNILLVLSLIGRMQLLGLAVAFSVSSIFQMFLLLFILRSRFDSLDDSRIIAATFKISFASLAAGVAIQLAKSSLVRFKLVDMETFMGVFTQLSAALVLGMITFIIFSYILKIEEFFNFKNSLSKRLFKTKQVIAEDTSDVSGI